MAALLLETFFETQDERFDAALRECDDDRALAALAERMTKDPRPWTRERVLAYLAQPLDRPGHHPLVKRLFKHYEAACDAEVMARFLVAFDRSVRHTVKSRSRWDSTTRSMTTWEELEPQRRGQPPRHAPRGHPEQRAQAHARHRPGTPLFRIATRHYLRRRAWRFFRRLGFRDPRAYVPAISAALLRYSDADLASGQDLLDCWGLVHALFTGSPALSFGGTWVSLAKDRTLAELQPAPRFPKLWQDAAALPHLLALAVDANAKLVRTCAQDLLRAHHAAALAALSAAELRRLLESDWEDVRALGIELFQRSPELARMTVRDWLALLDLRDPLALEQVVAAMRANVRGSRLAPAEVVALTCHRAVPVCRAGLAFLAERTWTAPEEQAALRGLRAAQCAALGRELGETLLSRLQSAERYDLDDLLICVDHRLAGMREAGMRWIEGDRRAHRDAALWARLAETPDDDVRHWMLRALERFAQETTVPEERLRVLWAMVLLGVHRGGRDKPAALRQLAVALVERLDDAPALLRVLSVALRSLRAPERRAALAAVVTALVRRPELAQAVASALPELDCSRVVANAGAAP